MSTDSPAEDLARSTVGGLSPEEAAALDIPIVGEDVWSRRVVRRATTHEMVTVLGQGDSGFSPVDSDTRCSGPHPRREGCWSSRIPTWLGADQRFPPNMTGGPRD